ncbi:hypothetical protein D3C76_1162990 [compost metagenome]
MDGVEEFPRGADKLHLRRIALAGQRIDLYSAFEHLGCGIGFAVHQEAAQDQPVDVTGRPGNEVFLTFDDSFHTTHWRIEIPLIVRWQDQVLTPLAAVRAGGAHVRYEAEVRVVDSPRARPWWNLDNGCAVLLEIQEHRQIDRVGVAGQHQRSRIQQLVHDECLVRGIHPHAEVTQAQPFNGGGGDTIEEGLHASHEVEVVIQRLDRRRIRHSVEETQCAQSGFDGVRGHDLVGNPVVVTRCLVLRYGN